MSPAEAAEVTIEPDWLELWDALHVADDGFDVILRRWRQWHWRPILVDGVEKKEMAPSVDGVIALAKFGIMPPRMMADRPPGLFQEQIDDHCWFVSEGRAWRILGVEDKMLMLNSFGDEWQIDLSRAKWEKYTAAWAAAFEAQRK